MIRTRLLLFLCGVVALGLLAEGAARLHGDVLCTDHPGAVYEADPRFGWTFVPHAYGNVGSCDPDSVIPWAPLAVDSHGLAQPERRYEKPPGTVRIMLLGGNLPAGLAVPPEFSIARTLEALADPRRGARVEVVNAGIGGFALDNDVAWFRAEGKRYAPDVVVVVLDAPGELVAISPVAIAALGRRAPLKPYFRVIDGRAVEAPAYAALPEPAPPPLPGNPFLRSFQLYRNWKAIPTRSGTPMAWADVPIPSADDSARARQDANELGRALLTALREETEAAGGKLVAFVAPRGGTPRHGSDWQARNELLEMTAALDLPTVDPGGVFAVAESARQMYLAGDVRLSAGGQTTAAGVLWTFLYGNGFLPGVVQAPFLGAPSVASLRDLGPVLARAASDARWSLPVQFLVFALAAVCLVWMFAPGDAVAWEWLTLLASFGVVGALTGPPILGGAVAFALVWYAVVERMPPVLGAVVTALLATGLVLASILVRPAHIEGEDVYLVVVLALAANVGLLRLLAYAVDRRRGAARLPLRAYLLSLFYFPVFVAGPIEPPHAFAARAAAAAAERAGRRGLPPFRAVPGALARLLVGIAELVAVVVVVNKIGPEVFGSAGAAIGRGRLWLWVGELTLSLTLLLGGWTNVVVALGTLVGIRPMENLDAPWRALGVADFWRRWHVSFTRWLHEYVYVPLGGSEENAVRNVVAVFAVSVAWTVWALIKLIGFKHYLPPAWAGIAVWGALNALGVAATRPIGPATVRAPLVRVATSAATLVVVSLFFVPWFLPAWQSPLVCVPIYLRLFFLR